MRSSSVLAILAAILLPGIASAETLISAFVDKDGPNVLAWDPATGKSALHVFNPQGWNPWGEGLDLPANPIPLQKGETCQYRAYVDKDGDSNAVAWNPATGKSRFFIYSGEKWAPWEEKLQLPAPPIPVGKGETVMFLPYVDKDGDDNLCVWRPETGASRFLILGKEKWEPWADKLQMPSNPLQLAKGETCGFAPYKDKDGDNLLVWNPATGKSRLFILEKEKWDPWEENFQLPDNPLKVGTGGCCLFVPYVDKEGDNNVLVWDPATGKSRFFVFYRKPWEAWDEAKQLPADPLGAGKGARVLFAPLVDKDGDNVIVWDAVSGKSKCWVLGSENWEDWGEGMQLPAALVGK